MLKMFFLMAWLAMPCLMLAQNHEICGDGIDNDNDGAIDEACQPFECDGSLYQSASTQGGNFFLYKVDVNPIYFMPIANLTHQGVVGSFNSLAYNPVDNLMYGMGTQDSRLYRIDANGEVEFLGNVAGLNAFKNAATCDAQGNYYVFGDNTLRKIDLNTLTYTNVGGPGPYGAADIVYNPIDNKIYGWSGGPKLLFNIDLTTGAQTKIPGNAPLANNSWGWIGALYFNAQGDILGYEGTNMIKIDPTTGIGQLVGFGSQKKGNDGCSCSFGVEMTKAVSGTYNAGDTITYEFEFFNQSFSPIAVPLNFEDILTNGFQWVSDPYNLTNLQLSGNTNLIGTSSANFIVNGLPQGKASFSIDAVIPCDYNQTTYSNQASLSNLPPPLKSTILSDNPSTASINDATVLTLATAPQVTNSSIENIICDRTKGSIELNTTGGVPPFSYAWNTGQTGSNITGLNVGNYTVSITNGQGCISTFETAVIEEQVSIQTTITPQSIACKGNGKGSIVINQSTGGTAPYQYALNNASFGNELSFQDLAAGSYTIYTKDAFGCTTQNYVVLTEPTFQLELEAPNDTTVSLGIPVQGNIQQNTLTQVLYEWTPSAGLSCNNCQNPTITAPKTTTYTIKGTDIQGCSDSVSFTIKIDKNLNTFIPNAFSPDGDRNNDILMIYSAGEVEQVRAFRIFDRWGNMVFTQENFAPNFSAYGWDGTFQGQAMNTGVFLYYAELELINGQTKILTGDVTLFR